MIISLYEHFDAAWFLQSVCNYIQFFYFIPNSVILQHLERSLLNFCLHFETFAPALVPLHIFHSLYKVYATKKTEDELFGKEKWAITSSSPGNYTSGILLSSTALSHNRSHLVGCRCTDGRVRIGCTGGRNMRTWATV